MGAATGEYSSLFSLEEAKKWQSMMILINTNIFYKTSQWKITLKLFTMLAISTILAKNLIEGRILEGKAVFW